MDHCTTIKFQPSIPQLALDSTLASILHLTTIDDEGVAGFTHWLLLLNQSGETHHLGFLISLMKREKTRDLMSVPLTVFKSRLKSIYLWSKMMFFFSG